jgi:hypothetical protein
MNTLAKLLGVAVLCGSVAASLPAKADFYFTDNDRLILRRTVVEPSVDEQVTFYTRGAILPSEVHYEVLPMTVSRRLSPAPEGDTYVSYGGNVYLIDPDRRIIDATELY